jgi:hypothetical protein
MDRTLSADVTVVAETAEGTAYASDLHLIVEIPLDPDDPRRPGDVICAETLRLDQVALHGVAAAGWMLPNETPSDATVHEHLAAAAAELRRRGERGESS